MQNKKEKAEKNNKEDIREQIKKIIKFYSNLRGIKHCFSLVLS